MNGSNVWITSVAQQQSKIVQVAKEVREAKEKALLMHKQEARCVDVIEGQLFDSFHTL